MYQFKVLNPYENADKGFTEGITYIGITKGNRLSDEAVIKWKNIADNVYLVYNE